MLCPVIVGREDELAELEVSLDAAVDGRGGMVLLAGEAGTGKTRLGRELRLRAESRGTAVLVGRAVEEAPSPYRPLAEALASAVRRDPRRFEAAELAPFRAVLGRLVPQWRSDSALQAETSAVAVGESLLRVLRHPGAPGCLMVLEDLHWADPDSLAVIEYLADNLDGEPILVLATLRPEERGVAGHFTERLQARRSLTTVELSRLDDAAAAAMIRSCLGTDEVSEQLASLVSTRSEGVPFLVEEVLATLVASGALQKADGGWVLAGGAEHLVPSSFAAATHRRLTALGPATAAVLRAAAVLGAAFDWRLLPAMTGRAEQEVLDALRKAAEAQVVQVDPTAGDPSGIGFGFGFGFGFRFRHALTAEALRAELLPPERAALADRALESLLAFEPDLAGPACELAASLAEAAAQHEQAARYLLEAADRASALGALATAETRLSRARVLAAEPSTRFEVTTRLLEVLTLAGRSDDALGVGHELPTLTEGQEPAGTGARLVAAHLCLARSATRAGNPALTEEHLRACHSLMKRHGPAPDDMARLEIERGEAALLRADTQGTVAAARAALATTERPELLCEAWMLLGRALRTSDLDAAAEAFDQARSAADGPKLAIWRMLATHELGTIDLFTTNRQDRLEESYQLAVSAGAFGALAAIELHLAVAADVSSNPDTAVRHAQRCTEIARRLGLAPLVSIGLGVHADAVAAGGPRQEVERLAEEILSMDAATPDARAAAWGALARASLCAEDHDRALSELDASTDCVRGQGRTTGPGPYYGYRALLAAVRNANGETAISEARALGAEASGWNRGLLACAEAVLAGRQGDRARAEKLSAFGQQRLAPYPGYANLGFRLMAQAAVEDGWGEPASWLTRALGFAEERRLVTMASACRGLMRRAGVALKRSRRVGATLPPELETTGITPRELEVLDLVGKGFTNLEISAHLYVSVRTVEKHVEALLRKTQLNRRTQLAALSARLPRQDAP